MGCLSTLEAWKAKGRLHDREGLEGSGGPAEGREGREAREARYVSCFFFEDFLVVEVLHKWHI